MPLSQDQHFRYTIEEWKGSYFSKVIDVLKENKIKSFIDLGANVGGVTETLLNEIPSIESCYLIEPEIDNFCWLYNKYEKDDRIILLNCGIYYGIKRSSMTMRNKNIGGWSLVRNDYPDDKKGRFNFFELEFFNFNKIDFIKIDVEWAEYNIIENSKMLKTIKFIEVELHDGFDSNYINKHLPNYKIIDNTQHNTFLQLN